MARRTGFFSGERGEPEPDRKDDHLTAARDGDRTPQRDQEERHERREERAETQARFGIGPPEEVEEKDEPGDPEGARKPDQSRGERGAERRENAEASAHSRQESGQGSPGPFLNPGGRGHRLRQENRDPWNERE